MRVSWSMIMNNIEIYVPR